MKYSDKLIQQLKIENQKKKERIPGRFHASELYGILKGYTTPVDWLARSEFDDESVWRMFLGNVTDRLAKRALEKEGFLCNEKKELLISPSVMIVCVPDAVSKTALHEFKTITSDRFNNPRFLKDIRNPHHSHRMQVECYLRAFELEEGYISYLQLLPRDSKTFVYHKDDKLWGVIKDRILQFDNQVREFLNKSP